MTDSIERDQVAELAAEVRRLSERAALAELIDRYMLTLDEGVFDEAWARSLFTQDAALTFPVGSHQGVIGLAEFTSEIMDRWARTHHHASNYVIELDGDRATVAWNVFASHVHLGSPPPPASASHFHLGGRFEGAALRTRSGWRLQRLALRVVWTAGSAAAGVPAIASDTVNGHGPEVGPLRRG